MRLRGVRLLSFSAPSGDCPVVDIVVDGGRLVSITPASRWGGLWVMPGLWDHHVHMDQWARASRRLDLSDTRSPAEVLERVREAARAHDVARDGASLVAVGLWHSRWASPFGAPGAPSQADLDAATGSLPTALISADLHSAWLNSAAEKLFSAPPSADTSGLVVEDDWFAIMPRISDEPEELTDAWVAGAARTAAARGITGIVDFEFSDTIETWRRRIENSFSTLRVSAAVWPDFLDAAIEEGLRTGDPLVPGEADDALVRMGPLKIIFDGSLNTRTAWCHDPYPDGTFGGPNLSASSLRALMARGHGAGIHSAIHAIGDLANETVLDAFEAVGARGTVEHAQLIARADIPRFNELGIAASVQPAHLLDDLDVAEELWAGRTDRTFPLASLHAAGAELRFGSDAPVARLDPWLAIHAAETRAARERPAWHPQERLNRAVALSASTKRAQLQVGDPADLVVLGSNPLEVPADELVDMPVQQTICAGKVTWEAPDFG